MVSQESPLYFPNIPCEQAMAQGNAIATRNLGIRYEYGEGVKRDYKEARRLFGLAVKLGYPQAADDVKRIDEKIRAEIIRKLSPLVGKRVVITGTSREDLNGRAGLARSFDQSKARYVVRLEDGLELKVKPANLEEEEE